MYYKKYYSADYPEFEQTHFHVEHSTITEDFPIHVHDFFEVAVICSGKADHLIENKIYPVEAGNIFVIKRDTAHGYINVSDMEIINLMFLPSSFVSPENDLYSLPGFYPLFITEPELRLQSDYPYILTVNQEELHYIISLTDLIIRQQSLDRNSSPLHIRLLFMSIIAYLSAQYTVYAPQSGQMEILSAAIQCMRAHLDSGIPISRIAELCYVSQRQLARIFDEYCHVSPIEYFISMKLEYAYHLIVKGHLPICQAAAECGFTDPSYFTRTFKKHYGFPPSELIRPGR